MAVIHCLRQERLSTVRRQRARSVLVLLHVVACAAAVLPGCGRGPAMAPVSGTVTIGGQPAERGTVTFMPDQSQGTTGKAAVGNIGADGTYTLGTFEIADGAIVGHHRVVIIGRGLDDNEDVPPDQRIPVRYASPVQSGLTAEVTRQSNTIDFDLRP